MTTRPIPPDGEEDSLLVPSPQARDRILARCRVEMERKVTARRRAIRQRWALAGAFVLLASLLAVENQRHELALARIAAASPAPVGKAAQSSLARLIRERNGLLQSLLDDGATASPRRPL